MLFIAEDPIDVRVQPARDELRDTQGRLVEPRLRGVHAKFKRGIAEPWALQSALQTFEFRKKPTDVDVVNWAAYYDSVEDQNQNGWTDSEREAIEAKLLTVEGVVVIERPLPQAPYALYDKHRVVKGNRKVTHAIKDIVSAYETAGFDVGQAVAYEQATLNDPKVVEALEGLVPAAELEVEPEEELISA